MKYLFWEIKIRFLEILKRIKLIRLKSDLSQCFHSPHLLSYLSRTELLLIFNCKKMFTTVRYFIKTSLTFLVIGILTGLYMSFSKYVFRISYSQEMISAHTHIILVGSVMMMIMGVALWFFPRAEKTDKKYNPNLIWITYWLLTIATALRFIFQILASFMFISWINNAIAIFSSLQVVAMILFFYSMWGRIRAVGSQYREAKGEKF